MSHIAFSENLYFSSRLFFPNTPCSVLANLLDLEKTEPLSETTAPLVRTQHLLRYFYIRARNGYCIPGQKWCCYMEGTFVRVYILGDRVVFRTGAQPRAGVYICFSLTWRCIWRIFVFLSCIGRKQEASVTSKQVTHNGL